MGRITDAAIAVFVIMSGSMNDEVVLVGDEVDDGKKNCLIACSRTGRDMPSLSRMKNPIMMTNTAIAASVILPIISLHPRGQKANCLYLFTMGTQSPCHCTERVVLLQIQDKRTPPVCLY